MCRAGYEACELTQQLANLLVVIAANLTRMRRLRTGGPLEGELLALDDALAEPIALARKLCIAVHVHDE